MTMYFFGSKFLSALAAAGFPSSSSPKLLELVTSILPCKQQTLLEFCRKSHGCSVIFLSNQHQRYKPAGMNWVRQRVLVSIGRQRQLHTFDAPSESLKTKIAELGKMRRRRSSKKDKQSVFVEVPESMTYLDTATMPQILTAVGIALFAKLLMMYDDSRSQELIERKIKNAPAEQGTVRMLSREEWEEIREVRPRTPFESKLSRPNARLRTGEPLRMEDVKDWTIDVLTDAFARVEESVRHTSK